MMRSKKTTSPAERWLGKEVRDVLSGVTGYCSSVSQQANGNIAVAIQPKGDGKEHPDPRLFDDVTVEELGEGVSARAVPQPSKLAFAPGDKVEHATSPFKGTVASIHWFLNGCVQYVVTSDALGQNGKPVWTSFAEGELQATPKAAKVAIPQTKTGGPSTRQERAHR